MLDTETPSNDEPTVPPATLTSVRAIGFDGVLDHVKAHSDQASSDLDRYYRTYTGRHFETFSAASDPWCFDGNDLAACAALSVPISHATLDALWSNVDALDRRLARCPPPEVDLATVDTASSEYRQLEMLYDDIRAIPGMGYVRTSKLLASKRPKLVPIRDSYLEAFLGSPTRWWSAWRELARTPGLAELVEEHTPPVAAHASILRRLDVICWMTVERQLVN